MSWLDTVFKYIPYARYNTITPSLTAGQTCEQQCDANGRLLVNIQSVNTVWSDSAASTSERVVKVGSGKLHKLLIGNTGASTRYIFFFNHAASGVSRPANASTGEIIVPIPVTAGGFVQFAFERPRSFTTGLYWGISSTHASFTYDSGGTFTVAVEYE